MAKYSPPKNQDPQALLIKLAEEENLLYRSYVSTAHGLRWSIQTYRSRTGFIIRTDIDHLGREVLVVNNDAAYVRFGNLKKRLLKSRENARSHLELLKEQATPPSFVTVAAIQYMNEQLAPYNSCATACYTGKVNASICIHMRDTPLGFYVFYSSRHTERPWDFDHRRYANVFEVMPNIIAVLTQQHELYKTPNHVHRLINRLKQYRDKLQEQQHDTHRARRSG